MQRETPAAGTGPLRHGNPRGNPNLAPRCGARTRAGCACRAPAMENGRCRMHGGASSGPRTEAGRARLCASHTMHGGYSAESQEEVRRMDAFVAETRALLARLAAAEREGDPAALGRLLQEALGGVQGRGTARERKDPMQREA